MHFLRDITNEKSLDDMFKKYQALESIVETIGGKITMMHAWGFWFYKNAPGLERIQMHGFDQTTRVSFKCAPLGGQANIGDVLTWLKSEVIFPGVDAGITVAIEVPSVGAVLNDIIDTHNKITQACRSGQVINNDPPSSVVITRHAINANEFQELRAALYKVKCLFILDIFAFGKWNHVDDRYDTPRQTLVDYDLDDQVKVDVENGIICLHAGVCLEPVEHGGRLAVRIQIPLDHVFTS